MLQTALGRAGDGPRPRPATLVRPDLEPVEVRADERPALVDVSGYRRRSCVDSSGSRRLSRRSFGLGKSLKVTTQSGRWC